MINVSLRAGGPAERLPEMIRGSVVVHRRRCGKPNYRCAAGNCTRSRNGLYRAHAVPSTIVPVLRNPEM
ncbi:DUF6788 family protein [Amycolatopsis magusensis]|uniref:DUF6788 family protein n=1 Tax=Amycolatopsis magusensis TaxID=882444 RepID=UPI0037A71E4E